MADIFDALLSARPYKAAWSYQEACAELERLVQMGKLDAGCVQVLCRREAEVLAIRDRYQDQGEA